MPRSEPLFDLATFDLSQTVIDIDGIRQVNPHRFEFEMLEGLLYYDREGAAAVGYHDAKDTEFWVRGHIPGRPLFPGVLQVETAAQACSYVYNTSFEHAPDGFFGFAALDSCKFMGSVTPGDRFLVVVKAKRMRRKVAIFDAQGFVGTEMVFEAVIKGALL